jgi:hypothetical protein
MRHHRPFSLREHDLAAPVRELYQAGSVAFAFPLPEDKEDL